MYRAWTEPERLRKWCAPKGFTIPASDGDLRPGGAWRATIRAPNGKEYRLVGHYTELAPPERLAFTHHWLEADGRRGPETIVTVTLEDRGGKTLITLVHAGFSDAETRADHAGGWGETLDRLAEHLWEAERWAIVICFSPVSASWRCQHRSSTRPRHDTSSHPSERHRRAARGLASRPPAAGGGLHLLRHAPLRRLHRGGGARPHAMAPDDGFEEAPG